MAFPENTVWKFGVKKRKAAGSDPEGDTSSEVEAPSTPPGTTAPSTAKHRRRKSIPVEEDLITINAVPNPPTRFGHDIRTHLTNYYCRLFYRNRENNIYDGQTIKGRIFDQIVDTFVLVLSCIVPTISIVLHYIRSQVWRLGFISLWAAGFSLCLSYFTGATHIQIFSASLGMAAVQVIFVSNGIGGS